MLIMHSGCSLNEILLHINRRYDRAFVSSFEYILIVIIDCFEVSSENDNKLD